MSVSDGQPGNAATFNAAFLSRTVNTSTTGKVDLNNADTASGSSITNTQREQNSIASFVGKTTNVAKDAVPSWSSDNIGSPGDPVKTRVDAVQVIVEANLIDTGDLRTLSGTADGATTLGTFTGTTIADSVTIKTALQSLETSLEAGIADIADIRTLTGTADGAVNLGTFTGSTITDNTTIKTALQDLETFVEANSGSGGTGKNYIDNTDAEVDTSGWATYADAAGTSPVDGTGGSPSVTFSRSTTTPLSGTADFNLVKGATNRQGDGVSYAFSIDSADQARMLAISFDWEVVSGTFSAGTSSTDSDVTVWIYDVTNSSLIQPATHKLDGAVVGNKYHFYGVFQTASNSTSYRLILHVGTTSGSAYTLALDSVTVGPQQIAETTAVSDWTAYTPTGSWSANTTYTGQWRRVGDSMQVQAKVSTGGTPTSATLTINLPSGYSIDTTKLLETDTNENSIGYGIAQDSATSYYPIFPVYESTTSVRCRQFSVAASPATSANVTQAAPFSFASGDSVTIFFQVPISGWASSSSIIGADSARVVAASASGNPASATSGNPIIFPTTDFDSHGAYNAATGIYTAPASGYYEIGFVAIIASGVSVTYTAYKNGISTTNIARGSLNVNFATGTAILQLNAGDTCSVRPNATVDNDAGNISFMRVAGPGRVVANEIVAAEYTDTTGDSVANTGQTIIDYDTKVFDTHGAVTTGASWKFTAPMAGTYRVSANVQFGGAIYVVSNVIALDVYKNTVFLVRLGFDSAATTTSHEKGVGGSHLVRLNAGDQIDVRATNSRTAGATTLNGTTGLSNISISKVN